MVKSLYNVANMFAANLSKKADFFGKLRTENDYKPDEFEEDAAIENDDEDEDIDLMLKTDDDEDEVFTGIRNRTPTFDDFAPDEKPEHVNVNDAAYDREKRNYENYEKDYEDKIWRDNAVHREENPKIWALFDRLQKENEENRANKKKASIINVANLYIKAAREDTKGAYFEDNADVPAEEESRPMRELLNETEEFPTEEEDVGLDINSDDDDDNDDDNFGDPGEIAPLTEEQAEALRQERLALIKERHQAWKANKDAPPPPPDDDADDLLEKELEDFDTEDDFEDENLELPEV